MFEIELPWNWPELHHRLLHPNKMFLILSSVNCLFVCNVEFSKNDGLVFMLFDRLLFVEGGDRTCRFLYVMPWIKKISTLHQHLLEYVMKDVPHTILHIHTNNSIKAVINCSKATQLFTNTTFCFVCSFNRTLEQHSTDNPDINVPGNK